MATTLAAITLLTVTGCSWPQPPSTGSAHTLPTAHIHAIVADPAGDGFLIGTHEGVYAAGAEGDLLSRVSDVAFDAMGLTALGPDLLASGHPGPGTPAAWGDHNLGVIRSADGGRTWRPVAFSGEADFHAMTAGADGTAYARAVDDATILRSDDGGMTWSAAGATVAAVALAVGASGEVVVATADGLQISTDRAASFRPWPGAPLLYLVVASADHSRIAGVDTDGTLWVLAHEKSAWRQAGAVQGVATAIAVTDDGAILVADDSGLTRLEPATR